MLNLRTDRTIEVSHPIETKGNKGLCVEAHDLAASKLVAYREKDRVFVTTLLKEGLIDGQTLLQRIDALPVTDDVHDRLAEWVKITLIEISKGR